MSDYPLVIIGGGLSGLAAGIRFARFGRKVLILEKHSKPGGLNSYYHRQGMLLETGLHAITNYAGPDQRQAPLNRLLRQLKLSRRQLSFHQQYTSKIIFPDRAALEFSNDFELLKSEIFRVFPHAIDPFLKLVRDIDRYDPFGNPARASTRHHLASILPEPLLIEMLLCPLMFYGGCEEGDMDFAQFVIMFRAIFQEGFFRPAGTIKDFLDLLLAHYRSFDGEIRFNAGVDELLTDNAGSRPRVLGVRLANGEEISCDCLLSTIGYPDETMSLLPTGIRSSLQPRVVSEKATRLGFMENIYFLDSKAKDILSHNHTIIFYSLGERMEYTRPSEAADTSSGVICFPDNFHGLPARKELQIRTTHLANYQPWHRALLSSKQEYNRLKALWNDNSKETVGKIIGKFDKNIVYQDSFTPITIERYTAKKEGAIYGHPHKTRDGKTPLADLFIAGTDQGFLGIVGSMLSGVTIVNQHIL